jgi:hypothetical protein
MIVLLTQQVRSCDICIMYSGVLPDDYRSTVGVFHRTRTLGGVMTNGGIVRSQGVYRHAGHFDLNAWLNPEQQELAIREVYSVSEFRMRLQFTERWSITALIPLVSNVRFVDDRLHSRAFGFGDLAMLAGWQAINTINTGDGNGFRHRMALHGGFRLPSGSAERRWDDRLLDVDMQPGKRAFDGLFMLEYVAMTGKFGMMAMTNTRYNMLTLANYAFGNSYNVNMYFFRKFNLKDESALFPRTGVVWEHASKDFWHGEMLDGTGGKVLMADVGFDWYAGAFSVGFAYQHALFNRWGNETLPVKNRIQAQIQFIF